MLGRAHIITLFGIWLGLAQVTAGASDLTARPPTSRDQQTNSELSAKFASILSELPALSRQDGGLTIEERNHRSQQDRNYAELVREKVQNKWFAALVAITNEEPNSIQYRFETWNNFLNYLQEQDALVEVWAYPEGEKGVPRRIPAPELADLKRQRQEQPTFITVTYPDRNTGKALKYRVEFGFQAAAKVLAAHQAYRRHRQIQLAAHEILGSRDAKGKLSAMAQWEALQEAVSKGRFSIEEMPLKPKSPANLFVAFEYEVDDCNNISKVARAFRESEIQHKIVYDAQGGATQILALKIDGDKTSRQAAGYQCRAVSDQLEPVPNPIFGQDYVELRIQDPQTRDPRQWHLLEFGEPEILRQSALSKFAMLNAHLDKQRKAIAIKKSRIDVIAEPIIAGLNIGGGVSGLGFPAGEAVRLFYNVISSRMIAGVPTVKEMRELFALLAAKDKRPDLKTKPAQFLSQQDIKELTVAGRKLSDAEVQAYLDNISDSDLDGMLQLARMGMIDARVSNFFNILTSAFKVSGLADEKGLIRDIFNNSYFSLNGDINLTTILAVALGQRGLTPLSGASLESLSQGKGPGKAWAQYFNVSVDARAVFNSMARFFKDNQAQKELEKPFPYALRMRDLAAYEFRVFGFPLLIFYKRGLLKSDYEAYQKDYAYGVIGARIVAHFPTQEDMEREIRAGRMIPLGYVKVHDGKGGWKESNLAVFANRVAQGKYQGKIAIVVYGLKAYQEHSESIQRELERFQLFEKALREGAVIEQLVDAQDRQTIPAREFEPKITVGPNAAEAIYAPLLSGLIELRRYGKYQNWNLPLATNEERQIAAIWDKLADRDIYLNYRDCLQGLDKYNSTVIYRKYDHGKWRDVKMTALPGLGDIERELAKAEEGQEIERMRSEVAAGKTAGIVLINTAREVNGRWEIGPLLVGTNAQTLGVGVTSGPQAMNRIFELINQLPVTDRARLQYNHFAATLASLDVNGDGHLEKVFLTIEFPPGIVSRKWINPSSGEPEILIYENGLCRTNITGQRMVEFGYDADGREIGSRTYFNQGTLDQPDRGALLEESRTLEIGFRNLGQADLDPYQAIISKLRFNYITGEIVRDTYGLFQLPVITVDDQYLTRNKFNAYGQFESAMVHDNGKTESDFQRPLLEKLLKPIPGNNRFSLTAKSILATNITALAESGVNSISATVQTNVSTGPLSSRSARYAAVEKMDIIKGLSRTLVLDNSRFGRKISESYSDPFDGIQTFTANATAEYREDFFFGMIPEKTVLKNAVSGTQLAEIKVAAYDPLQRRLTGVQVDYTGKISTNTWDYRWENPVEVETSQRRSSYQYNREETALSGNILIKSTGEQIRTFSGQYEATNRTWRMVQQVWHKPGILLRVETNILSGFGKLIVVQVGGELETRPAYREDGTEQARLMNLRNPATGQFDARLRLDSDYRWKNGEREAHVQTFVEGQPYDQYDTVTDSEGRTIVDGIKQGLAEGNTNTPSVAVYNLRTVLAYDGDSERILRSETFQNKMLRQSRTVGLEEKRPDGTYQLPIKLVPAWGLICTQYYVIGDPLARPLIARYENGQTVQVSEWFPGTAISKVSELRDRHGRPLERRVTTLAASQSGGPSYDTVSRFKVGHWGNSGWMEDIGVIRGTDISLFQKYQMEQIYYDLAKPYDAPQYALSLRTNWGVNLYWNSLIRPSVTKIFRSQIKPPPPTSDSAASAEPVMILETVDLLELFSHPFIKRTIDRGGKVIEEQVGKIEHPGGQGYVAEAIFKELDRALPSKQMTYHYDAGWWVEGSDPNTGVPLLVFTNRTPSGTIQGYRVNVAGYRESVTQIEAIRILSKEESKASVAGKFLFRRISQPCELKQNKYMPGISNVWTRWIASELDLDGKLLYNIETIYNAQGEPSASITRKRNSSGEWSDKIAYQLTGPNTRAWKRFDAQTGRNSIDIDVTSHRDISACDFIYYYVENRQECPIQFEIKDASGRLVVVGDKIPGRRPDMPFWPVGGGQTQWFPNEVIPQHGAVVNAPAYLSSPHEARAIAVSSLASMGLDVRRIATAAVVIEAKRAQPTGLSPLYQLARSSPAIREGKPHEFGFVSRNHSSGLDTLTRTKFSRTAGEIQTDVGWNTVVQMNGRPIGMAKPNQQAPFYPILVLSDFADPDLPRPLYTLAPETGKFVEYYHTLSLGNAQVYSVVNGFETPKLEVFRSHILDDEISAGLVAYGFDYGVMIPMAKASGGLSKAFANLQNRMVASIFKITGDRLFKFMTPSDLTVESLNRFNQALGTTNTQAGEIDQLPMLAQAILPRREVPWLRTAQAIPANLSRSNQWLGLRLQQLTTNYPTELIPTALGSEAERYVDTVEEAALIKLAIRLGEGSLAGKLLDFYWDRSQGVGGTEPLHASYDAMTGASLSKEPNYKRPVDSARPAAAQIAIAEAALRLGLATGDTNTFILVKNLTDMLLKKFRPFTNSTGAPRGIAEYPVAGQKTSHSLIFWPEAEQYSLKSNARAYLLLKELNEIAPRHFLGSDNNQWRLDILDALPEQEKWLRIHFLSQAERLGVLPKGLFEVQDVFRKTTAYAVDRWTQTEDWLAFLEAVDQMGVPKDDTRRWLDNLARVHGVVVRGIWGLDWNLALRRPDAISTQLTAKFWRLARQLDHPAASAFASQNLVALGSELGYPVVFTDAKPDQPLNVGRQTSSIYPNRNGLAWPLDFGVYAELAESLLPPHAISSAMPLKAAPASQRDISAFYWTAAAFYLAILTMTLFWWLLRVLRKRPLAANSKSIVPDVVMQRAEERWAKRVLGVMTPQVADRTRFSNGAIEQNFHMQLRAIYKLVMEWRRLENGWDEKDDRLVEDDKDSWLNGLDEFATLVGIYSRWVVKAGKKDGLPQEDPLLENEDSNHIWSRLVLYFSEYHWGLLQLIKEYVTNPQAARVFGVDQQISTLLRIMGARQRFSAFDVRRQFNYPAEKTALDLLILQLPGATLTKLVEELDQKLDIPQAHFLNFLKNYKTFKYREQVYPTHPHFLEAAKLLPHFVLMGLVALILYNQNINGLPIYPYLQETGISFLRSWSSLIWALPVLIGFAFSIAAYFISFYRYKERMRTQAKPDMILDSDITSFFSRAQSVLPSIRPGWPWDPVWYERVGWTLRGLGFVALGTTLIGLEAPSFATFMLVKGLFAPLLFAEAAAILLPLIVSQFSMFLEDWVSRHPNTGRIVKFLNQLNLTPTRPTSLLWLAFKYHFQPSVPTGGTRALIQSVLFYFVFASTFFVVGGYLYKEVLRVWFSQTYHQAWDWDLVVGAFLFWNTMYLLRFGLFVLFTGLAASLAAFPIKTIGAGLGVAYLAMSLLNVPWIHHFTGHPIRSYSILLAGMALMAFEHQIWDWFKKSSIGRARLERLRKRQDQLLQQYKADASRAFAVVYMSGDDLSYLKLNPELLMSRWSVLRDNLGSDGLRLLASLSECADDATLNRWLSELYATEKKHDLTLWHPMQLLVAGDKPRLPNELGLNLLVETTEKRQILLKAWHIRRWLVTMMSTAGHAQDTGINLVDIALRLADEGLSGNTVFYLIQNKYDNNDNNRPVQAAYDKGELGQRNKLARLLMAIAPGSRSYNINDWTPFGFKAGGLVGMDLIHEESLKLTNMLVLDRNANAHDLDSLMEDIKTALTDPGTVIIIPGRSTTNTRTPIGQGSQLIEEGHRAQIKGLTCLGGAAGESVGTGWGNIQAVYYGRIQRAMLDPETPKMPLTSRMRRGSNFFERVEGLIGFGPHAVGISEDIWGVTQAAHNAIALGYTVKFRRSKTLWHKIRESWSHSEWFAAFPRWSGGYLQMMLDPIMQRINDGGSLSVFAKELRANCGRFFLGAPFALMNILLMPLAIIWDVSPFVQILIVLWNFGLVMNQVLTVLGLVACLESTGFHKLPALLGAGLTGLATVIVPGMTQYGPALIGIGFLAGGFAIGLGRWLYDRGRDLIMFGPQLVIHALGQVIRQSLEFVLSGASAEDAKGVNIAFRAWVGPREDRPFEAYQNMINLRTVVWIMGLFSMGLNLYALANLDFFNVLLLLPSLFFSVSTMIGPFLLQPKPGVQQGKAVWLFKLLGWLTGLTFYTSTAWLLTRGGIWRWMGLLLLAACLAYLLRHGLRYFGYSRKLRRLAGRLSGMLEFGGLAASESRKLAQQMMRNFVGDLEKILAVLKSTIIPLDQHAKILDFHQNAILPIIRLPLSDMRKGGLANSRFASEFKRSCLLSLFTFLWFFIVPIPGLLVFTASDYRVSLSLSTVVSFAVGSIGIVLLAALIGRSIEWWTCRGIKGLGLLSRIQKEYRTFQSLLSTAGTLTESEISSLYALFTDTQTYMDQRSFSYARTSLDNIKRILTTASTRKDV